MKVFAGGRGRRLAALVAAATMGALAGPVLQVAPAHALAPTPTIDNSASGRWLETASVSKDTTGEKLRVTVLVKHDPSVSVSGLAIDDNWDGTDSTATAGVTTAVTMEKPSGSFNYTRVTYTWIPPNPSGFSCGFLSGTRRVNNPLRLRAVTSDGQRTAAVSATVHAVENNQCTGPDDFGYLRDQTQDVTQITPGQSVNFTFSGDDSDSLGDDLNGLKWRTRRLNDGVTSADTEVTSGICDNCTMHLTVPFSQRGRYVVEAQLRSNGTYEDAGQYFYIGAVDVDTAAATSPTASLSAPSEVNVGDTFSVNAAAADGADSAGGGRVQMVEWDADGVAGFEGRDFAADANTGVTAAQLTHSIDTTGMSNGPLTITARVTDNGALNGADNIRRTKTATSTVYLNAIPVAQNQAVNLDEDTTAPVTLVATDADAGQTLTYAVTSGPSHGTLTGSAPNLTYAPAPNYNGADSFTFTASDGHGGTSAPATVSITINPVNDPPVADPQSVATNEDTPVDITLTGSDVDGDTLSFTVVSGPAHGAVSGSGAVFTYSPAPNYNGTDAFDVIANDGNGGTSPAVTISLVINPVNDAPVPDPQSVTTPEDTGTDITLTASDVDGDPLAYAVVTQPAHGTLTGAAPNVHYMPDADYNGADSFDFSADDGSGAVVATVSITVTPVNDAPVAANQSVTTDEDTSSPITLGATDVDGDALTYSVIGGPTHGSLSGSAPNLVYTPDADYNGPDAVSFRATDPSGASSDATVSITVSPVNDAPVAGNQSLTTNEDTAAPITLSASDVDGDALTYEVVVGPTHGSLSGSGANLTYTPAADYNGGDSLTFVAHDGNGGTSAPATVSITVIPVNDAPVADSQSVNGVENTPMAITLTGSDIDGDSLTYEVVSAPAHGTLSGSAPNLMYTPANRFNGNDAFQFVTRDPSGATSAPATVSIFILGVNDPPDASDQSVSIVEDTPTAIALDVTDPEGDTLTITITNGPDHGTLSGTGTTLTYTPAADYNGPDVFSYRADDGNGGIATATVNITVQPAPLVATTLTGDPVVARILPDMRVFFPQLTAQLTRDDTGAGVAGRTVVFSVGGSPVCSAVTDANGEAACGGVSDATAAALAGGFQISFAGDFDYLSSTGYGPVLQVSTVRI